MAKARAENEEVVKVYVAKGRSLQKHARAVLACMRNTSTAEQSQPVACCATAEGGELQPKERREQNESCEGVSSDAGDAECVCVGDGDSKRLRLE